MQPAPLKLLLLWQFYHSICMSHICPAMADWNELVFGTDAGYTWFMLQCVIRGPHFATKRPLTL